MPVNITPIYSGAGDIQGGDILTTQSADYTGQGILNVVNFMADATYGGYVQRMRFKALGTNIATVARIYINNGNGRLSQVELYWQGHTMPRLLRSINTGQPQQQELNPL
jgi:hypothetical protein